MTIVVVISPDAAKAIAGAGNARFVREVCEGAVCVVPVERVMDGDAAVVSVTAVYKINIWPTVCVKIGNTNARAELLEIDSDASVALEVGKRDTSSFRDVAEFNAGAGLHRLGAAPPYRINREPKNEKAF
jgi:hypothetical protein